MTMATTTHDGLRLCPCCAIACANADVSGCEDGNGHQPHALSSRFLEASIGTRGSLVLTGKDTESIGYFECDGCDETAIGTYFEASILDGVTD
jgi:hypothetical protein